jgi:VWFA-related protein
MAAPWHGTCSGQAVIRTLLVCVLAAQEPQPDFVATYNFVTAPVTVRDSRGRIVNGLTEQDFQLFDKGVPQKVTEDEVSHPISMVVAVQASGNMEKLLPGIRKLGNLINQFVLGENGELAVLAFDHRIQTMTGFTSDPDQISSAFKNVKSGSGSSHLNDAAMNAIHLLRTRPRERRRILLLIAETHDYGSEVTQRDVSIEAGFADVVIYSVGVSSFLASLTSKTEPPRPNPIPPEARMLPAGVIGTLTTDSQGQMGNLVPIKDTFKANLNAVYARITGGREYSYLTQRGLEQAIVDLGEEIHSQYLLTYLPSNREEIGDHDIEVKVSKPGMVVRTRTSYSIAPALK